MREVLIGGGVVVLAGALFWAWRSQHLHTIAKRRLLADVRDDAQGVATSTVERTPALRRWRWVAYVVAALTALLTYAWAGFAPVYCIALAVIVGVLGTQIEGWIYGRTELKLETQLADAIDLMVAALSAGAGVMEALDSATRESRKPLKVELQELMGRIRYGEAPKRVFEDLADRVPLETFRLFSFTMAVHGEVGGSLAPTLSTVGKSIRDRIEIGRRIKSQATQAQASVIGIVGITWFLGLLMWRSNPGTFEEFLRHPVGANFLAGAMVLQAIGLLWITRLAKPSF